MPFTARTNVPIFAANAIALSMAFSSDFPASFCAKPAAVIRIESAMATPLITSQAASMSSPAFAAIASGISAKATASTAAAAAAKLPTPLIPPSLLL